MTQADVVYADVEFKRYNRRNPGETSPAPEITYSEVKIKQPSGATSPPTQAVYSELQSVQQPPDSQEQAPPAGGSKVTSERATLAILATLLAAAVVALIGVSWNHIQSNRSLTDSYSKLNESLNQMTSLNRNLTESLRNMTSKNGNLTERNHELNYSLHQMTSINKNLSESNSELREALDKKSCPAAVNTTRPCPLCPVYWEEHGGQCYLFSGQRLNWTLARKQCQQQGADLVRIDSEDEQTFLTKTVNEKMEGHEDKFWIGLTDADTEGHWLWVDGSPLNRSLTFWQRSRTHSEPDNWREQNPVDGEDCARMGEKSTRVILTNWFDTDCNSGQKSICEKAAVRGHLFCV